MTNEKGNRIGGIGSPSRRDVLRGAMVASASTIGLAGCLGDDGDDDDMNIGYVIPTSGPYGAVGEEYQDALTKAVEDVGGSVDDRNINVLTRDSGTSPDVAVPTTEDLIREEDLDMIIGALSSAAVLAMQDIAAREEIPYLAIGGTNFDATGVNCNRYTFVKLASGYQYAGAPLVLHEQGLADSIYFVTADYAGGHGPRDGITATMEEQTDAEILGDSLAPLGNDDYSTQIQAARDSGADLVWAVIAVADTITFINQAAQAGLHDDANVGIGISSILEAASIGSEIIGTYSGTSFYHTAEGSQEFTEEWLDMYGRAPSVFAADAYDCVREGLEAVNRAGSLDADDIIDELEGNEFDWTRPGQQWRACDHRAIQPYYAKVGKPEDERQDPDDYFEVIGSRSGEEIMRACEDTGCEM